MQVKNGSKTLTVDLVQRTCDCRVFELTGIPCPHAVAAIHSRREQPVNYVSKYYTRKMYLESYKYHLGALKGEEFWESHSTDEMLPPYIPKRLRGRPKKQRRREEWEGGNRSRTSVPIIQRFPSGKKMHCSIYRQPGHRCTKCPNKTKINEDVAEHEERRDEDVPEEEERRNEDVELSKKSVPPKRSKLPVRRKETCIVIKEPRINQSKGKDRDECAQTGKGKEKVVAQPKVKIRRPYLNLQGYHGSQSTLNNDDTI